MKGDEAKLNLKCRPNAVTHWAEVEKAMSSKHVAIFLDYDGTLSPIVGDPALAIISAEMTEVVKKVSQKYRTGIVTGRARETIHSFLRLPTLYYAASHGFDVRAPGDAIIQTIGNEFLHPLMEFKNRMTERCALIKGSLVEDNLYSISIHYRHVAEVDMAQLESIIDEEMARSTQPLRRGNGKKVFEIKPAIDWNKGKAVELLLSHMFPDTHESILAVYLGDDVTDEDAFRFLRTRKNGLGMGVWVKGDSAERDTSASYMLDSVDEVMTFLSKLVDIPVNSKGKKEDGKDDKSAVIDEKKDKTGSSSKKERENKTESSVVCTKRVTRSMKRKRASVAL